MPLKNSHTIANLLHSGGITWRGEYITEEKVDAALKESQEVLEDEPVGTQYQRGGLIVRKETSETYDVYVFLGSLN